MESSTSPDRIPTERLQTYASVNGMGSDDDDYFDDNFDDDNLDDREQGGGSAMRKNMQAFEMGPDHWPDRQRRKRLPPGSTGHSMVLYCFGVAVTVLGLCALGLVGWNLGKGSDSVLKDPPAGEATDKMAGSASSTPAHSTTKPIHYDFSFIENAWNPFDLESSDYFSTNNLVSPFEPFWGLDDEDGDNSDHFQQQLGYYRQPDIVNNTLVFVSEGDLYLTTVSDLKRKRLSSTALPAMKLTTTVGNVLHPKINPVFPYLVAYTATYTGRREVYLMDLRKRQTAHRLTYIDSNFGVVNIAGWKDNGKTLVISAYNMRVGLPDQRLYEIYLAQPQKEKNNVQAAEGKKNTKSLPAVLKMVDVPLSQAAEGFFWKNCWYFTRVRHSSETIRYVGGTAESLWMYCLGRSEAIPLTPDFNGTSKAPTMLDANGQTYLLFLSDRSRVSEEWKATTMNLWAMSLPTEEMYDEGNGVDRNSIQQLTKISCQFNGISLREYSVDIVTGNIVLRVGADLYKVSSSRALSKPEAPVKPNKIPVQVFSDFHEHQERMIKVDIVKHLLNADIFTLAQGGVSALLSIRGQVFAAPVQSLPIASYEGSGENLPRRRYRVAPGSMTAGAMRVIKAIHVPLYHDPSTSNKTETVMSVVLATDPLSPTAEQAFYLVPIHTAASNAFQDWDHLPKPFLGGHVDGGSTADGGLGTVLAESVTVSPCGRRLAWADTDGRICVMTLPTVYDYNDATKSSPSGTDSNSVSTPFQVLPETNELGEPLTTGENLLWSPGGWYLVVGHQAANQFKIISIVDCGCPETNETDPDQQVADITIGRIVQATPSRFNSFAMYWGNSSVATALYFLTDRDVQTDVKSPWGSRAPSPHFTNKYTVYALPLEHNPAAAENEEESTRGRFSGGGAAEVFVDEILAETNIASLSNHVEEDSPMQKSGIDTLYNAVREGMITDREFSLILQRRLASSSSSSSTIANATNSTSSSSPFPHDIEIDFGPIDLTFARKAYRMAHIPEGDYNTIVSQTVDDGSLVLIAKEGSSFTLKVFVTSPFPSDSLEEVTFDVTAGKTIVGYGISSDRNYFYLVFTPDIIKVFPNKKSLLTDIILHKFDFEEDIVDTTNMAVSVWPSLEYRQLYSDAWRLLRDYFYDIKMHGVEWPAIHDRYLSLVRRCGKREELDDVLAQMAAELSALHVFVYGGEYNSPFGEDKTLKALQEPASLGATLQRTPEWKGYKVLEIPERDPDFNIIGGKGVYCPISEQALRPSGQRGLLPGDIIVGVNGESVMLATDINMLLRGTAGRSVRLDILRLSSSNLTSGNSAPQDAASVVPEPLVVAPISFSDADTLRYKAWEWKTRQKAKELAEHAGFSVGYIHLASMGTSDMNTFARDFFPDYDKQGLILDVRHNKGGNIDSWVLDFLQRKAFEYWAGGRTSRFGHPQWDEHFAFRGHIVVLIDEKTSSDGEGVSRGMSELGLGRLIGKRTWGGGIWLSSDNKLVDGGIATAPELGTYNDKFGWGLGIEAHGVDPDIEVDNNPRSAYDGTDVQLERAIIELKNWLLKEPVVIPTPPSSKPDMALHNDFCAKD